MRLHQAILYERIEEIKRCIKDGCSLEREEEITINRFTRALCPIDIALEIQNSKILKILLNAGASPGSWVSKYFYFQKGQWEDFKILVEYGMDVEGTVSIIILRTKKHYMKQESVRAMTDTAFGSKFANVNLLKYAELYRWPREIIDFILNKCGDKRIYEIENEFDFTGSRYPFSYPDINYDCKCFPIEDVKLF